MKRVAVVVGSLLALAAAWIAWRHEPEVSSPSTNAVTTDDSAAPRVALDDGSRAADSVRSAPATPETPPEVEAPIAQAEPRDERCIGTATMRGFVVDEAGLPIEGATLRLHVQIGQDPFDQCLFKADTDRAGRFELRELTAGPFTGDGSHDEFLRTEIPPGVLARDAVVECATIVLRRALYVAGQVVQPDGTPAPRTQLVLKSAGSAEIDALTHVASTGASANGTELAVLLEKFSAGFEGWMSGEGADDEGRFRFGPLEDGVYELSATFDPSVRTDVPPAMRAPATDGVLARARTTVKNVRPSGDPMRVVLEPTLRIRGSVVAGAGGPVREFRVRAAPRLSGNAFAEIRDPTGTIDAAFASANGEFELGGFDAGEYEILASTEDGRRSKTQVVRVPQSMPRIEFVLHDNASIAGVVHDSSGKPVPGARVAVRYPNTPSFVWETNQHGATADEAGKFVISALPPDRVTVDVWAQGFQTNESALEMELRPAQVLEGVVLKLERKR
ncbi:MAG: carboxypeptidase-like regulatory domain-containing protein [Planctomycetota bacterium]